MVDSNGLKRILDVRFRANPNYEIVLLDRLPEDYRQDFKKNAQKELDTYGLLWPRSNKGLTPKAICHETALLLYTMREPGFLPAYVRTRFGVDCNRAIAELVLDNVLEIEDLDCAGFVSGAKAHDLLYEHEELELGVGRIPRLSHDALRYGQMVSVTGSAHLSTRLYTYNTIPISMHWRVKLPDSSAIDSFLGIQSGSPLRRLLDRVWVRVGDTEASAGGWVMWRLRSGSFGHTTASDHRSSYKLYVSPKPEALPDFWPKVIKVFADYPVHAFKIGKDIAGLLRPDKILAYFDSFENLAEMARLISSELRECPAQGTPFTAGIGSSGLLSWGMDPPFNESSPWGRIAESWRSWITKHLAVSLIDARENPDAIEPWKFAIQRLQLDGVNTKTWSPNQQVWKRNRSA